MKLNQILTYSLFAALSVSMVAPAFAEIGGNPSGGGPKGDVGYPGLAKVEHGVAVGYPTGKVLNGDAVESAPKDPDLMKEILNNKRAEIGRFEDQLKIAKEALSKATFDRNVGWSVGIPAALLGTGVAIAGGYFVYTTKGGGGDYDMVTPIFKFFGGCAVVGGAGIAAGGTIHVIMTQSRKNDAEKAVTAQEAQLESLKADLAKREAELAQK